ncbi:hypothetical protein F867_gp065 [Staphylococcus phage JD007]|uniref:Uncharacterized protein n=1 Tax=Staphylococcus phage JD007 TaxID=1239383 RepID=K7QN48_9CAUD|nr:hypothetical protein F867_gp065 [Staphylococcus phage JD007]AFV50787.1 hypothetical protein [Staphylococcus phage JD007]AVX47374.1 hypothetical protein C5023_000020 [Staphylococcus phage vB_SauM_0414_108]AVX47598.1 hypothetical protein C5023_000244 [Staphylococcus phage vB_SauM_0414_108]WPH67159.1 hypothetical protein CUBB_gp243 [Staphylococcus phage CUB-B]
MLILIHKVKQIREVNKMMIWILVFMVIPFVLGFINGWNSEEEN